ncbi:MAG: hypothetical protein AB7F86_07930 [Bdellovibrionales bacterium]
MIKVKEKLLGFVNQILEELGQASVDASDSLFVSGRLDSLSAIKLLDFVETEMNLGGRFQVQDLVAVDSVDRLCELIQAGPDPTPCQDQSL